MITHSLVFIHFFTSGFWTSSVETGVKKELIRSGIQVTSRTYNVQHSSLKDILAEIKLMKNPIIVASSDFNGEQEWFTEELGKNSIPVFFAGKKEEVTGNKSKFSSGVYSRNNYNGALKTVEKVTGNVIKKIGNLRSTHPIFNPLVDQFVKDASGKEIIDIKVKTFEEWSNALNKLVHEDVDLLVVHLPYGVTYKGKTSSVTEWPVFAEELKRINKKIPRIGGSIKNSKLPLLLSFGNCPYGMGKQTASLIYRHIKTKDSLEKIGFEQPQFNDLQINVEEFERLGLKIPEDLYMYATLINNKANGIVSFNNKLDDIDNMLTNLLSQRQDIILEMAKYRKAKGLNLLTQNEEKELFQRRVNIASALGLDEKLSKDVYSLLFDHGRKVQTEELKKPYIPVSSVKDDSKKPNLFSRLTDYLTSFF